MAILEMHYSSPNSDCLICGFNTNAKIENYSFCTRCLSKALCCKPSTDYWIGRPSVWSDQFFDESLVVQKYIQLEADRTLKEQKKEGHEWIKNTIVLTGKYKLKASGIRILHFAVGTDTIFLQLESGDRPTITIKDWHENVIPQEENNGTYKSA